MIFYNNHGFFDKAIKSMTEFSSVLVHASTPVLYALPTLLRETGPEYREQLLAKLKASADSAFESLKSIKGLHPI
jgi:hypothetical protein